MSSPQLIDLVTWIGPGREQSPILEHSPIQFDDGAHCLLRGNLTVYIAPPSLPKTPGLHLIKAEAHTFQRPGFGYECRLVFLGAKQLTGDLAELLANDDGGE